MSHMPVAREEPYSRLATDRLGPRTVICEAVVRNDASRSSQSVRLRGSPWSARTVRADIANRAGQ